MSAVDPLQKICSENEKYSDWRKWCRLCAKCDAVDNISVFQANENKVLNATLAAAIGKYFWVNIKIDDSLSRELCKECHTLMNELILFAERVNKVQAMYCVLQNIGNNASIDPNDVRKQYGLHEDEWEHIIKPAKPAQVIDKKDSVLASSCAEEEEEEERDEQDVDVVEQIVEYDAVEFEEEDQTSRIVPVKEERDDKLITAKNIQKVLSKPTKGTFIIKNKTTNSARNVQIDLESDEKELELEFMSEEENDEVDHFEPNSKSQAENNTESAFSCDLCSKKCKNAETFRLHLIREHSKSSESELKEETKEDDESNALCDMKETEFEVEFVSDTEDFNDDDTSDVDNRNEEITNNIDNSGDNNSQSVSDEGSNPRKRRTRRSSRTDHFIKVSKTNNNSLVTKEPRYHCDICGKPYKSPACYRKHMFDAHNKEANIVDLPCEICGQTFFTEKQLAAHMRKHLPTSAKLDFECSYCEKRFTTIGALRQHVSGIHFDEKPFICDECGKPLRTMAALNEHKLVHTDDKPVECEVCGKGFKNKARMKVHMDTHASTEYTCSVCGLGLNTRRTLKMHMLVHTDEKHYKCTFCPSAFKRSKALKNHLILHTGLRPYVCNFCKKTFSNGSNCRAHKKKVHPIELAKEEKEGKRTERIPVPNINELRDSTHIVNPRKVTRTGGLSHHMRALLIAAEKREKLQNSNIVKDESDTMDTMESYVVETEEYSTIITDSQTDEDDVGETIIYEVIDEI